MVALPWRSFLGAFVSPMYGVRVRNRCLADACLHLKSELNLCLDAASAGNGVSNTAEC